MDRNPAGQPASLLAAQFGVFEQRIGKGTGGKCIGGIVGIASIDRTMLPHCAVEKTRGAVRQAKMSGQRRGESALARCGDRKSGGEGKGVGVRGVLGGGGEHRKTKKK